MLLFVVELLQVVVTLRHEWVCEAVDWSYFVGSSHLIHE